MQYYFKIDFSIVFLEICDTEPGFHKETTTGWYEVEFYFKSNFISSKYDVSGIPVWEHHEDNVESTDET